MPRNNLGRWPGRCKQLLLTLTLLATALYAGLSSAAPYVMRLGQNAPYDFLAYANADVTSASRASRAVVLVHGVRRNADDYFETGLKLLNNAGLDASDNLLLSLNFLTAEDRRAGNDMPLWARDTWMHGTASEQGRSGIEAFAVLDDVLAYLANRKRFPALKEVVLIGHSAGGQLMQRYAVLGEGDGRLARQGIAVRYVISSPSSYLYLDGDRMQAGNVGPVSVADCPDYNRYRYGLEAAPPYLARQHLGVEQLVRRYAARDVLFMVGERDDNPEHRVLDRSCAAALQGPNRVERQRNYLRYEAYLSQKWGVAIHHPQITVAGVGHDAARLLTRDSVARRLFPER
ncbi:alpha/beta hydrolase family protein [Pseudomonas sp. URMO17WK12:I1]|nr:alpha/beta hydrolase family protein [Pseudomonas sp. URMO17WK12:I1]